MDYKEWIKQATPLQLYTELINLKFVMLENLPISDRIRLLHNELMQRGEENTIEISESEAMNRFSDRFYV